MGTPIVSRPAAGALGDAAIVDRAREYAEAAQSPATRRAYAADLRDFGAFCDARGASSLPATPQLVAIYVTQLADRAKLATVRRRLAAITKAHRERGLELPTRHEVVRQIVRGVARTNGSAQTRKSAVTVDALRAMLLEIHGDDLKAKRDRAILLLGFAAALRRSELAALKVDDLLLCKQGVKVRVRRSKTDQTGQGAEIAVPIVTNQTLCAVRALRVWLEASGITEGPVFRSFTLQRIMTSRPIVGGAVAELIQSLARRAHLEGDFSGHSLRAGFATSAAQAKVSLDAIARTTRHKSLAVLLSYVRPAQLFDDVALTSIVEPRGRAA